MKQVIYILLMSLPFLVNGQDVFENGDVKLDFESMAIDLGNVKHGESKSTEFTFVNTGNEAVEIEIVDGCVCTTLDWTRGSIQPGESGKIDVLFDSTEKEKSETVDIDVTLKNKEAKTGNPIFIFLTYSFELIK